MRVAVQVYGRLTEAEKEALARSLRQEFASLPDAAEETQPISPTFLEDFPQAINDEARRPCDVRICILNARDDYGEKTRFFQTLINRYPLVPVVFQEKEGADWSKLSEKARRAVETSWWWIVRPIDLPVMIVDRGHQIVKANHAALEFFGPNLVGRPYRAAVEGTEDEAGLPDDHPVREALGPDDAEVAPRGISRYRDVSSSPGKIFRRALLVCFPLINNLDRTVTSVVVFYVDLMNRFDRINDAVQAFALADGVEALQKTIVEQVGQMRYRRARLYEYNPDEKKLYGRTSIGFSDAAHEEAFTRHEIEVEKDGESCNTINNGYPGLFIYEDAPRRDPESDLVHYCKRGEDSEKLEKTEVNRWVDAPLLIPVVDKEGKRFVRPWGKISVDQGKYSDGLSPHDVANLSALAAVAGGALGEKIRAGRDEALLTIYETYTRELDQKRPETDEPVMPLIKGWLLELFRKLFDLDLALYREFRPEARTLVYKDGLVRSEKGYPLPGTRIPESVGVDDYPSYERFGKEFVDDEGTVIKADGIKNYTHNRPDQVVRLSPEVKSKLSEEEIRYLDWIKSEIGIPIVVKNKVRGVIVGMSGRLDAFPPDCDAVLRRFRSVAHLWFQLGELRDARTSAIATLGNCLRAWSLLQGEDDQKLYAGLAAILTAGCGLGWHRALIFRNIEAAGTGAELVYAVGGLGEKDHGKLQGYVENTERDVVALVRKRIEDPRPHGFDDDRQVDRVDSLYERYIESPRPRPRISYADGTQLFETLRRRSEGQERAPYVRLHRGDHLIRSVNERCPDLFAARTTYFFPLYSNKSEDEHRGPLGFIAIDNAYRPNPLEETALALTAAIVELARDQVAARLRYRLYNGMLGALPFLRHGPKIGANFAAFNQALNDLVPELRDVTRPAADDSTPIAVVRRTRANLRDAVDSMAQAQVQVEGLELPDKVADLKAHLLHVIKEWEGTRKAYFLVKTVDLEDGLSLDCDTAILDSALRCVLENAESVSKRDAEERFLVELRAAARHDIPGFEAMVTVEITDHGPGVSDWKAPFLFIDGFTDRQDLPDPNPRKGSPTAHKGLGLGMARAFLLRSHGELRLKDRGGDGRGATFVLQLGLVASKPTLPGPPTEPRP